MNCYLSLKIFYIKRKQFIIIVYICSSSSHLDGSKWASHCGVVFHKNLKYRLKALQCDIVIYQISAKETHYSQCDVKL